MTARIAIDTGGTFTDFVLFDRESKQLCFHKAASTPDDPSRSLIDGLVEIVQQSGSPTPAQIELLIHGTTVATNAVLQRRGARTAFVTTQGFRDVLHIQRQDRPHMYDLRSRRSESLVPRSMRFEVEERVLYDGTVETPLSEAQLEAIAEKLAALDVEAVAIGFLHSFTNPDHERLAGQLLAARLPNATVCLSHELVQQEGEYERFSTCAMNAFVQPVMARYLGRIEAGLQGADFSSPPPLFVMKSNGGAMAATAAATQPVQTILSGPAGGVVAGRQIASAYGEGNIITCDMGGTSFDVAVIHEGRIAFARDAEMAGLALKVPMLDIHTIGAGGGSIAWTDAGGALRVGPQSAGAHPGPACYGRGGSEPTVTDANLVLGRLAPKSLLGGGMELDLEAARRAIRDRLATPLNSSLEAAAEGIIRVVNASMTAAIRKLTVERGHDPRSFTLCPFGGAGPLHGAELAREIGVEEILVPVAPGLTSAVGLLMSDLREDAVRTDVSLLSQASPARVEAIVAELEQAGVRRLAFAADHGLTTSVKLGLRYRGQGYDMPVDVDIQTLHLERVAEDFHAAHEGTYGFARRDQAVELVNIWVSVEVDAGNSVAMPDIAAQVNVPEQIGDRPVIFEGQEHKTPVFWRSHLGAGARLEGPAVIEQLDSTTLLWPGQRARVDAVGQIVMEAIP